MRISMTSVCIFLGGLIYAQSPQHQTSNRQAPAREVAGQQAFDQAIAAGDFAAATKLTNEMDSDQRDIALAKLARAQRRAGDYSGASTSAGGINNPGLRESTSVGAAGGGGAADFTQLMALIEGTIQPDIWQNAGGTSRMTEYPGGVLVDSSGLVAKFRSDEKTDQLERIATAANGSRRPTIDWRKPSRARAISLRNLHVMLSARLLHGVGPDEAIRNLAGITRLFATVITEEGNDVILVGEVGSLAQRKSYGWCDTVSGRTTLRLEDLTAMLDAVNENRAIGCSIDPTQQGLVAVQNVAEQLRSGKLKGAAADKALADALGNQQISLIGLEADEPASLAFVIADRHMKMLALGEAETPKSIRNYFKWTESLVEKHGLPDGQLLRMWFTGSPVEVKVSANRCAWWWEKTPIQLLTEKQLADARGERRAAGRDPRAEEFAKQMTTHFGELSQHESIYGRLAGLFELGLGLGLAKRGLEAKSNRWAECIGILGQADGWQQRLPHPPRMVPSLVASHSFRRGNQRHAVTVISGGVELRPNDLSASVPLQEDSKVNRLADLDTSPADPHRWWWDL